MAVSSSNEYGKLCNCYSRLGTVFTQPDNLMFRPLPKFLSLMVEGYVGHPLSPLTMQVASLHIFMPLSSIDL